MGKREHESTTLYLALTLLGEGSATVPIALVKSTVSGRIKTSHFFSFKPVRVILARGYLSSRQIQR